MQRTSAIRLLLVVLLVAVTAVIGGGVICTGEGGGATGADVTEPTGRPTVPGTFPPLTSTPDTKHPTPDPSEASTPTAGVTEPPTHSPTATRIAITTPSTPTGKGTGATSQTSRETAAEPRSRRSRDNPWRSETVTIGVETVVDTDRNYTHLAVRAASYWNENIERFTDYAFRYEVDPTASDPDVRMRIVSDVDCGEIGTAAVGCAPIIDPADRVVETRNVTIEAGRSNVSTTVTMIHELGHISGQDHTDRPWVFMSHNHPNLQVRNASERANPWVFDKVSVYVERDHFDDADETVRQVRGAVEFYDRSANGTVPADVAVQVTGDRAGADIVVAGPEADWCREAVGSVGYVYGRNVDGDPSLERHTSGQICVGQVAPGRQGWHVGYWLGRMFGLDDTDHAPIFNSSSPRERESDWWD